jgi:hypothetical protein
MLQDLTISSLDLAALRRRDAVVLRPLPAAFLQRLRHYAAGEDFDPSAATAPFPLGGEPGVAGPDLVRVRVWTAGSINWRAVYLALDAIALGLNVADVANGREVPKDELVELCQRLTMADFAGLPTPAVLGPDQLLACHYALRVAASRMGAKPPPGLISDREFVIRQPSDAVRRALELFNCLANLALSAPSSEVMSWRYLMQAAELLQFRAPYERFRAPYLAARAQVREWPRPRLAVVSLSSADRAEFDGSCPVERFEEELFRWAKHVESLECDSGYKGTPDDFNLALWERDRMESFLAGTPAHLGAKLRAAADALDERYRAATIQDTEPDELEPPYVWERPYPGFPAWWWSRSPARIDQRPPGHRTPRARGDDR